MLEGKQIIVPTSYLRRIFNYYVRFPSFSTILSLSKETAKKKKKKNDIRRFAKPYNQHPTSSGRRDYFADSNRFRIPRLLLDTRSRSSAADSGPVEVAVVARNSPDSWAAEEARRTADKMSCPCPVSNRLDCEDLTYRPTCASVSPVLGFGTWDRDFASQGSRTPARGSPFSPASSAGTWSPRSCCARVAAVVVPRPPVSAVNKDFFFFFSILASSIAFRAWEGKFSAYLHFCH